MRARIISFVFTVVAALAVAAAASAASSAYVQSNLVTFHHGGGVNHDRQLSNPWGIAFAPGTFIWISDNNTGVSTLYDAAGKKQQLVVTIPPGMGQSPPSNPTGVVVNPANNFTSQNPEFGGGLFLFATENGTIASWEATPSSFPSSATTVVDNSAAGAVYKALAIASDGGNDQLYVTNFRAGTVEVYTTTFSPATNLANNAFVDPMAIAGFAPFGIFNINGTLFVTYARQDAAQSDEVNAAGSGFIDEFGTDGTFIKRFATGGNLDSPWGIVMAPSNFGPLSNDLLVGNFGDGRINAFDPDTGNFIATMTNSRGHDIVNPGLWALVFGVTTSGTEPSLGSPTELFFTAGGAKQNKGTFGDIQFANPKKTGGGMTIY
jgi:uncharacterized protein (TIGR03118 family)